MARSSKSSKSRTIARKGKTGSRAAGPVKPAGPVRRTAIKVRLEFHSGPTGVRDALYALGAIREIFVGNTLPAELYAAVHYPGAPDGIAIYDDVFSLVLASKLFRGSYGEWQDGCAEEPSRPRPAYDLTLDTRPVREHVKGYADEVAELHRARLRIQGVTDADEQVRSMEQAWDAYNTLSMDMIRQVESCELFKGRMQQQYPRGLSPWAPNPSSPELLKKADRFVQDEVGDQPFILVEADADDSVDYAALLAAFAEQVTEQTHIRPLVFGRWATGHAGLGISLLEHPNCQGYIGGGWLAYAAWALGHRMILQFCFDDPLFYAVRSASAAVATSQEDITEKVLVSLGQYVINTILLPAGRPLCNRPGDTPPGYTRPSLSR